MQFAFDEIHTLKSRIHRPVLDSDPVVRYICALISELAYYHVPQFEIDDNRRAQVIPCAQFRSIISHGIPIDATTLLQEMDVGRSFVAVDRSTVAVGLEVDEFLFIGFRGTKFGFDWKVNSRARLIRIGAGLRIDSGFLINTFGGQLHSGFAEESVRISMRIMEAIKDANISDYKHIFLAGHSLGGAVAALAANHIKGAPQSTVIFGSPRYCDASAYFTSFMHPPVMVRRSGDMVPFVPPRKMGYADHPNEYSTKGTRVFGSAKDRSLTYLLWKWTYFVSKLVEPHKIEAYRRELGETAGAAGAGLPCIDYKKLIKSDVVTN